MQTCWPSLSNAYFRQAILGLSVLALPAFGQTTFIVLPSQISGIRIDGPGTPEFTKHIADLAIDAKPLAAARDYLARAVIVTNMTDQPVRGFVVRFDYVDAKGGTLHVTQWQEPREGLAAGAILLVGESGAATEGMRSHGPEDRVLESIRRATNGPMIRSQFVRASLDSFFSRTASLLAPMSSARGECSRGNRNSYALLARSWNRSAAIWNKSRGGWLRLRSRFLTKMGGSH